MPQVYTTSTGAGNRIESKERYLYEKDHRANKKRVKLFKLAR